MCQQLKIINNRISSCKLQIMVGNVMQVSTCASSYKLQIMVGNVIQVSTCVSSYKLQIMVGNVIQVSTCVSSYKLQIMLGNAIQLWMSNITYNNISVLSWYSVLMIYLHISGNYMKKSRVHNVCRYMLFYKLTCVLLCR